MEIVNAQIKFLKKGGFYSACNENVKHIKVLPYLSIVQSVEGSYDIALGNEAVQKTGDGGFFIAPSNIQQTIVHHVSKKSEKMTCRWLFVDVEINKVFKLDSLYQFPVVINDDRKNELNRLFDRLFATEDIWENYSDCYKLLGCLMKMATSRRKDIPDGVRRALSYMAEHYREPLTVEALAKIANISESNFYSSFKKHMGNSPISYLNHYRLSIAADKLAETDDAIGEVAYWVGINDPLYFSKIFKRTYGMTPREYRILYRAENEANERRYHETDR